MNPTNDDHDGHTNSGPEYVTSILDACEIEIADAYERAPKMAIHAAASITQRAEYALKVLGHFALVSAREDGEDSAGRQKLATLTPAELATKAFDIADAAFNEIEARGQFIVLPTIEKRKQILDDMRAANEKEKRETLERQEAELKEDA